MTPTPTLGKASSALTNEGNAPSGVSGGANCSVGLLPDKRLLQKSSPDNLFVGVNKMVLGAPSDSSSASAASGWPSGDTGKNVGGN